MYEAAGDRYQSMTYRRSGKSGLQLPAISLGLWHNFGGVDAFENCRAMLCRAFDLGITHFDLANNYGPPPGSAEETFGRALRSGLGAYRDQMVVSTKAGYEMWPGPYGNWGSRKYLLASLDQSLARMGLDYVDIFYSHRPDPETPLEETLAALACAVHSGKALYAGISNYDVPRATAALAMLRSLGVPCLIHQMKYSMFQRAPEDGLFDLLASAGCGAIAFSPLAQGLLTGRYLDGIPAGSRASKPYGFLKAGDITPERLAHVRELDGMARARRQSLAQMALAWVLRQPAMTSALVGASSVEQLVESVQALRNLDFTSAELSRIDQLLA